MKLLKYCLWHLLSIFNILIILPLFLSPVNPPLAVISILFPLFVSVAIFFSRNENTDKNKDLWTAVSAFCIDFVLGIVLYDIINKSAMLREGTGGFPKDAGYILYLVAYVILFTIVNAILIGILKLKQKSLAVTK